MANQDAISCSKQQSLYNVFARSSRQGKPVVTMESAWEFKMQSIEFQTESRTRCKTDPSMCILGKKYRLNQHVYAKLENMNENNTI